MLPFWGSGYVVVLLRQAFRPVPRDFVDATQPEHFC